MTNEQNGMGFLETILACILGLYGISIIFFMFYFSYLFIKGNGFILWVALGELFCFFKAILWPVFIFVL